MPPPKYEPPPFYFEAPTGNTNTLREDLTVDTQVEGSSNSLIVVYASLKLEASMPGLGQPLRRSSHFSCHGLMRKYGLRPTHGSRWFLLPVC